jgi:hypothetical protein
MFLRFKRLGAWLGLLALSGCAGRMVVPMDRLADPPRSESYLVTTVGGEEMEFVTFRAVADTLHGTVKTVRKRLVGAGAGERMEVRNEYREVALPVSGVRSVEIPGSGPDRWLLVAAGAVVAGGIYLVAHGARDNGASDGGTGKTPPGNP